jgi:hypothetical protein
MDNEIEKTNRSEFFDAMMKERIKHSNYHKFVGISPEGFTLVPNEVLEELKDFDIWKEFKNDEEWIEKASKKHLKKSN